MAEITALAKAMLGVVPGLKSLEMGPPLASTAQRAQGFNLGLLAVLESEEHLAGYATHPAHVKYVGLVTRHLLLLILSLTPHSLIASLSLTA